jgi:predicted DNA-binding transcriptional regulator YafY
MDFRHFRSMARRKDFHWANGDERLRLVEMDRALGNGVWQDKETLASKVNKALIDQGFKPIAARTFENDWKELKERCDEHLFTIEESTGGGPKGRSKRYRYSSIGASIFPQMFTSTELKSVESTIEMLNGIKGLPNLEFVEEFILKLKEQIHYQGSGRARMEFEQNADYNGNKWLGTLFAAISERKALSINYLPFNPNVEEHFDFHPYYLKQYNHRWFCYGLHSPSGREDHNLALDRIQSIKEATATYKESEVDWEDYFLDFVGATKLAKPLEEVQLLFTPEQAKYEISKPIHNTQRPPKILEDGRVLIRINVIPNFELTQKILSYGDRVEVLQPISLREEVAQRLDKASRLYQSP